MQIARTKHEFGYHFELEESTMVDNKSPIDVSAEIQRNWALFHQAGNKNDWSEEKRQKRLSMLGTFLGFEIPRIAQTSLISENMQGHVENFIGSVEVPIGLAGPLSFYGDHAHGPILAPLATTEGALVASACRGAKLLNASGGVRTKYLGSQMTRAPSFTCRNLDHAVRLAKWVQENIASLRKQISEEHAHLLHIEPLLHGRSLSLEFFYSTDDAAGQNMATIASWDCCHWIIEHAKTADIDIIRYAIDGGLSGDKKIAQHNFSQGRGTRVIAEARIPSRELEHIMRVSSDDFIKNYLYDMPNYFLNGSIGLNANLANIIAALFTATGQDIACVHESSLGQLSFEPDDNGIYASLLLPCLVIGTVGGGTGLPCQAEALKSMGCMGQGSKARLAEIIAGYCLALELSTLSAVLEGTFVDAHRQLGRPNILPSKTKNS